MAQGRGSWLSSVLSSYYLENKEFRLLRNAMFASTARREEEISVKRA